jgi:RNA polymerase sigma-70 factor (ECF subfamily)
MVSVSSAVVEQVAASSGAADERKLFERIRAGDLAAADELVNSTYGLVFASVCRMSGDRELAADLTQDTYRKAWESFGDFDGRARFSTWLYRIAYTTYLNHIRRPMRVVSLEEQQREFSDHAVSAEDEIAQQQQNEHLRRAVLALPEELRFTVTAHFWGELAVREIAELERVTTVAIRKRLNRAYSLLESAMQKGQS